MKATETKLLNFLQKSSQFTIPIYQRVYSWTEPECLQLWEDIMRAGQDEKISSHFIGSIVYIEKELSNVTDRSSLLVIDGQQRLTTISLIIEALARQLDDNESDFEPVVGFSSKKLRGYYLINSLEEDEYGYKLLLTQTDKESLLAIIDGQPWPTDCSIRVKENFEFFEKKVRDLMPDFEKLCKGLDKLLTVEIALSRGGDNPQLIFESMNSTGRELTQADLIRNFILMDLEPDQQEKLYKYHWRKIELAFGHKPGNHFDNFMRHYLTVKTGKIPKISKVHESFKEYTHDSQVAEGGMDALVQDIHTFAEYYCSIALGKEKNERLSLAFQDLREREIGVAYPFLLEVYSDWKKNLLSDEEMEQVVRLVESYSFRRLICNIPTNSMNKTFAAFCTSLKDKNHYLESINAHFQLLPSYRRFPKDAEFIREIKVRDIYNSRSVSYCLRKIANYEHKEPAKLDELTVEHIMPQNLSEPWQKELGIDWQQTHGTYLHTLGNLTLTGYNSEYSNRSFSEKRDMPRGFKDSNLELNRELAKLGKWDEQAIKNRADSLATKATEIWKAPSLAEDILNSYSPSVEPKEMKYSIEDHKFLAEGTPTRILFDAFSKEILAFDPCISEEFLKYYIAYKAETNFVDVEPKNKDLKLIINLQFHELNDSKGIARDVTNIGVLGNGDVEVRLNNLEDLGYIVSLVRQAFDKQMLNESIED